ncbi:MAG TPA: hypothetical protein VFP72_16975 [Kineosporiaceae bacterium]|nr:hypothetical protein [Kineosporiaceae bacterium]
MTTQVEERAQPPIKWPHPTRIGTLTLAMWVAGLLVALLIPAAIVPPTQNTATPGAAWSAFAVTVLGAGLMIAATIWSWRKTKDAGVLILGFVPGTTVIVGGILLATVKVLGLTL